jgi:2-methoxy-6-polyprenyl-1,4-benzoquinol methylase
MSSVKSVGSTENSSSAFTETVDFGFTDVNKEDKESLVKEVFSNNAKNYDVMNDLMSAGTHRLWKDDLVNMFGYTAAAQIDISRIPRHLDVAGGTGDVAFRSIKAMHKAYGAALEVSNENNNYYSSNNNNNDDNNDNKINNDGHPVVVCDINAEMLAVGKSRAEAAIGSSLAKAVDFVEGNAESLPFESDSFDLYTIAFGLRNVTNKQNALKEAYRVLRKGGRLLILEFSHIPNPILQNLYDQYSFEIIPKIGQVVANDEDSYRYLVESIRRFPKQEELVQMVHEAGFKQVSYKNLSLGIVAIHSGFKV